MDAALKTLCSRKVFYILLVGAAFSFAAGKDPSTLWQRPSTLSGYQCAWKTMNKSNDVEYALVKSTSNIYEVFLDNWGEIKNTTTECWRVTYLDLDGVKGIGKRSYDYKRSGYWSRYTTKEPVAAVSALNYTARNAVHYEFHSGRGFTDTSLTTRVPARNETDPVIFTDGETCDLFSLPRTNNSKACELWVNEKYRKSIPPCCSFIFDLLCAKDVINGKVCTD